MLFFLIGIGIIGITGTPGLFHLSLIISLYKPLQRPHQFISPARL